MRLSIATFALFAVAVASSSAVVKAQEAAATNATSNAASVVDQLEDALDQFGKPIEFIETTGDHDFDDDDEDEANGVRPVRRARKHHHRSKKHRASTHLTRKAKGSKLINGNTRITWYASNDLKNPQCGTGKWDPSNNSHIGAVMAGWKHGPKCGEFVYLCNEQMKSDNNCLMVRVIDKCAGCHDNWVDLTKSAFKQLDPKHSLDTGVVPHLKLYSAGHKPSPWDKSLFGPLRLAVKE